MAAGIPLSVFKHARILPALCFLCLLLLTVSAQAGTITSVTPNTNGNGSVSSILGTVPFTTIPEVTLAKDFHANGPIDVTFNVAAGSSNAGSTTYVINEGISNNTGVPWTDYHEVLGRGSGVTFSPFTTGPITLAPYSNTNFSSATGTPYKIDYTGGTVASGSNNTLAVVFTIVVPNSTTAYTFTLEQSPSTVDSPTPEPGTFVLAGLGAIGLFAVARQRRRKA